MNKIIGVLSGIFVVAFVVISFGLSFLSPYSRIEAVYKSSAVTTPLRHELNLNESFFLLSPVWLIEEQAQRLDYVDQVAIERSWPNQFLITVTPSSPVACNDTHVLYVDIELLLVSRTRELCTNVPQATSPLSSETLQALRMLDLSLLGQMQKIVEASDYLVVTISDIQVTLYPSQLPKLSSLLNQEISSNAIDIRANYS